MNLKSKILIVLAAASLAFAVGCANEDDCTGDECIGDPLDSDEVRSDDSTDPSDCEAECAHLQNCDVINDLECVAMCTKTALSPAEIACVRHSSCNVVDLCLDLEIP